MSRGPRQIHPGHLTEITLKTFQARFLLKPNKLINKLLIGILARPQKMTGMTVCAVVAMSNHIHLLVVPSSEEGLVRFCQYIGSNISLEVGRAEELARRRLPASLLRHRRDPVPNFGDLETGTFLVSLRGGR
jgi:REP element-mobilizing transposase RayT